MYSKTVIVGNLARDPDSRQAGETSVTRLVVAVNDPRQKDKVSYVDVEAWSKLGDICKQYLSKGRQVLVDGRLVQDVWGKDGKKNSKLYVKADNVQFLGKKGEGAETANSSAGGDEIPFLMGNVSDIIVELTPFEMCQAGQAGVMRQVENLKLNRKPYYGAGSSNDWQLHIEGCLGENGSSQTPKTLLER